MTPDQEWAGRRARGIPPSLIRRVFDLAQEVPDAISPAVGESDFPTPPHIVEARRAALRDGFTGYSPNAGDRELREAIAEKLRKANGLPAEAAEVFVTVGALEALMLALLVGIDPGDEVVLTDRCHCSDPSQIAP